VITDSTHPYHTAEIFKNDARRSFEYVQLDFDGSSFTKKYDASDTIKCTGSVALLSSMEQNNYGAFLLRVLPKISTLSHLKIKTEKYIVSAKHPWQVKLLELFGIQEDQIINYNCNNTYHFEELYVPDMQTSEFIPNDITIDYYAAIKDSVLNSGSFAAKSKKLYVSRLRQARERPNYRVCQNEIELIRKLDTIGFEIYEPERDTIEDQIRTFASASIVVGGSGAAMFNTIFCHQETLIISIEPMVDWVMLHANLYAGWGHPYAMVLGGADLSDVTPQKRWIADIDLINNLISDLH
jgi:capsular polysaccharide biosynthesis protein